MSSWIAWLGGITAPPGIYFLVRYFLDHRARLRMIEKMNPGQAAELVTKRTTLRIFPEKEAPSPPPVELQPKAQLESEEPQTAPTAGLLFQAGRVLHLTFSRPKHLESNPDQGE